jgi:hypothetical protein
MQQKDVIYIDVEDDITAIIGKVKDAKEKVVALVPPKRTGVLQSAVNLKLLVRTADESKKRLVIITHNAALSSLAASAAIPVAKTLQSRPEIAKLPTVDDDDENLIDGGDLPIGDHARMAEPDDEDVPMGTIEDLDIDGETAPVRPKRVAGAGAVAAGAAAKAKSKISVPDFGSFRKKMVIGAGGLIVLIAFLVWANVVAPHATVVVSAKTTGQALSTPVTLGTDQTTSTDAATIKSIEQTEKSTQTVDFTATGSKNVGDKATGTVKLSQQSLSPTTVPAGTHLTASDGHVFILNNNANVPASTGPPTCFPVYCPGSVTVTVTAAEGGADYNGASGSLSGAPSGVTASFTSSASGGTDKTVPMVTQSDVENAKEQIAQQNQDDMKSKVLAKFSKDDIVIDSSLTSSGGDPTSSPAIGEEAADGKAKLTVEITYTMTGIAKDELNSYLDDAFDKTLTNKDQQRVYDNGLKSVKFDDFKAGDKATKAGDADKPDTATLSTTAQVGPKINDDQIKDLAKGKPSGEVMADIKGIDGVSDVSVKLSPFWVSGVPDDVKKISIEFKLLNNG